MSVRSGRVLAGTLSLALASLPWVVTAAPRVGAADPSNAGDASVPTVVEATGDAGIAPATAEEVNPVRARLAALSATLKDDRRGGPALAHARELIDRAEGFANARRVDEARLAESAARTWLDVAEVGLADARDRARDLELVANLALARTLLDGHAHTVAALAARREELTRALGDRESRLVRTDAGASVTRSKK